jgi:chromosome segregation ATPase
MKKLWLLIISTGQIEGAFGLIATLTAFVISVKHYAKERSFGKTLGQSLKKQIGELSAEVKLLTKEKEDYVKAVENRIQLAIKDREAYYKTIEDRIAKFDERFEEAQVKRKQIREDLEDLEESHDELYKILLNRFLK